MPSRNTKIDGKTTYSATSQMRERFKQYGFLTGRIPEKRKLHLWGISRNAAFQKHGIKNLIDLTTEIFKKALEDAFWTRDTSESGELFCWLESGQSENRRLAYNLKKTDERMAEIDVLLKSRSLKAEEKLELMRSQTALLNKKAELEKQLEYYNSPEYSSGDELVQANIQLKATRLLLPIKKYTFHQPNHKYLPPALRQDPVKLEENPRFLRFLKDRLGLDGVPAKVKNEKGELCIPLELTGPQFEGLIVEFLIGVDRANQAPVLKPAGKAKPGTKFDLTLEAVKSFKESEVAEEVRIELAEVSGSEPFLYGKIMKLPPEAVLEDLSIEDAAEYAINFGAWEVDEKGFLILKEKEVRSFSKENGRVVRDPKTGNLVRQVFFFKKLDAPKKVKVWSEEDVKSHTGRGRKPKVVPYKEIHLDSPISLSTFVYTVIYEACQTYLSERALGVKMTPKTKNPFEAQA